MNIVHLTNHSMAALLGWIRIETPRQFIAGYAVGAIDGADSHPACGSLLVDVYGENPDLCM